MRPAPRIKFIWGASRVIRGRWYLGLFGFYVRIPGTPDSGLAISVRGLLGWLAALALIGYVALASALFQVWKRNPHSLLTYSDALLYPVRRAEITSKKGRAFIAQGLDFFREQKYHDAANLLRLGLARHPNDPVARATLAQYYMMANQRPVALRVLQEGLTGDYPGRAYLETFFSAAEQAENSSLIADASARFLPHVQRHGPEHDARWLLERRFVALSNLGRHDEALQVAESAGGGDAAMELRVTALLAAKRPADALNVLAEWERRAGPRPTPAKRLSVRAFREMGQFEKMAEALDELREMKPGDPAPLVFGVVQRAMAGTAQAAAAQAAFDDYVFRFGGSVQNLLMLAEPLGQINDAVLLERCVAAAKERGFPLQRLHSLLVETWLHRGQWDAAERLMAAMSPETGRDAGLGSLWREWVLKLIDVAKAQSDAAQLALVDFLRQRPWPSILYRKTVDALAQADRPEAMREVLVVATRTFPASAWFAEKRTAVEAQLAAANANARAHSAGENEPAVPLDEQAYWENLDAAVAAKQWSAAATLLHAARAAKPAPEWLARRDAALHLVQVRVGHGLGDKNAMIAATRLFLNGDNVRSQQIVDAAKAIAGEGDKDSAVTLVREVLRRVPDFAPARALGAELQPPSKEDEKEEGK